MKTKRINLISGPRNISTALMYAFANREDTLVVDEPMYAYYLHKSGVDHPGRQEILNALPTDLQEVLNQLIFREVKTPYYFIKGMAHHYYDLDLQFLLALDNVFLIRHPALLINSFSKVIQNPGMQDIGVRREFELFQYLQKQGKAPIVMDSGEVLKDPEKILTKLCNCLDIPFSARMLQWEKGPRKEDGVWAKFWYSAVHESTGFVRSSASTNNVNVPDPLQALLNDSMIYYNSLFKYAIKA